MTTGVAQIVKTSLDGTVTDVAVLTAFSGDQVFVETRDLDFGSDNAPGVGEADKLLECIVFDVTDRDALSTMSLYVGVRQRHNDTLTYYGPYDMSTQDAALYLPHGVPEGRYFRVKIVDSLPIAVWKISRMEFYGEVLGTRLT